MTDQTEQEKFEPDIGRIEELIGEYCGYDHGMKLGCIYGTCLVGEFIYLLQLASIALYTKQDHEAALDGGAVSRDHSADYDLIAFGNYLGRLWELPNKASFRQYPMEKRVEEFRVWQRGSVYDDKLEIRIISSTEAEMLKGTCPICSMGDLCNHTAAEKLISMRKGARR